MDDTIAAIATPAGAGGVGIVRVSGARAAEFVERVVGRRGLPDRRLVRAIARDPASGERLDEVLVAVMRAPRSFTGEEVAEIHGHGGAVNMGRLLRAVVAAGARHAAPGEFTRRAFAAGRIDLTQAEAVLGIIEASSERALRMAQAQLEGSVGAVARGLRERATGLLAAVEASIEFPEEGLELPSRAELGRQASALGVECRGLADTFAVGRAVREGIAVALVGEVNAGKSSLFNRLVGRERALVAEEPGTTRDFVEAEVVWDGVRVSLIDTAGLREAESEVERRGIELGAQRAAQADVIVELTAAGRQPSAGRTRTLGVVSKADLLPAGERPAMLVTSAVTGEGIEELKAAVIALATGGAAEEEGVVVSTERQRALLDRAATALAAAGAVGVAGQPEEVLAVDLRDAVSALSQLLGLEVGDSVLDDLFARFCIGK